MLTNTKQTKTSLILSFIIISTLILSITYVFTNVFALQGADFAIYAGSGTWEPSKTAFKNFLEWKGLTWEEINKNNINNRELIGRYRGLFMPGGWAGDYNRDIKPSGDQHIRDFINQGGAYIGMSAGAFYACDITIWEGNVYDYPSDIFDGDCIGPIDEIASWPNYVMTTMNINKNPEANVYEPAQRDVLYYGEPYFVAHSRQEMLTMATWIVPLNPVAHNAPGIISFNYGQGRIVLVGPHPEIEEDDARDGTNFADELFDGQDGSDWPFLWTAVDWLLKNPISQPPGVQPKQCNDGLDNDLDSLIDYPNDPGCIDIIDNDETDQINETNPIGVELFFDGFESCNLNGWTLSTIENNWYSGTTNPYAGSCYAETKPMNTNEPASIIEKSVNTSGYSNIIIEYYRKLIGLDVGDEFKSKWHDGSSWKILEETAGGSANNDNYIYKTFSLPISANNNSNFKIRFECTAGAVSEFCRVDNVKVKAE